jgi:hypothetical protein
VNGKTKNSKAAEAAIRNTLATADPKKIVAGKPAAKQNQNGNKRAREDSDIDAPVVDLSSKRDREETDTEAPVVDLSVENGAAATSISIPAASGGRAKRGKKDSGGENISECSWKCQTLSMQQGLKCQVGLVSTSACRGSRFACQACSDHATGASFGSIVCYECADSAQTKRWYTAKDAGKKHFCLV